jgi:SAM-dependent methyltransferase
LVEVGSATGHFLAAGRRAGFEVVGIEPATGMAAVARERFGVEVLEVPLEEADLGAGRFDVACAWHVLEHVPQPLEPLERILRSLRPGGWFLLEVPNAGSVRARREGPLWGQLDLAHHVAQYSPRSLRVLIERAGFQEVQLTTVPGAVYRRWPRALASYAKQSVVVRGWPAGEHPAKHELLRGVARAPV